jgi:hypothetical protein
MTDDTTTTTPTRTDDGPTAGTGPGTAAGAGDATDGTDGARSRRRVRAIVDTDVPPGAPAVACERCGRPFARESYLALHRGLAHDGLDEAERTAYEEAVGDETAALRRFRIVALGALVLLYFGFLFAYAAFT